MSASSPAIRVAGVCNRPEAAFLLVRFRKNGTVDWSYAAPTAVAYGQLASVMITAVAPSTVYNVELAYLSNVGEAPSSWVALANVTTGDLVAVTIDGQGDLATLDQVDTPQIVDEAVTVFDQQVQLYGFGFAGGIPIAFQGAGSNVYTQLDEYTFTHGGEGTAQVQWVGLVQWQANSSKSARFFLCLNQTPSWTGAADDNYQIAQVYFGNQNALTTTAILSANFPGLAAGTHTVSIWAKSLVNSNVPVLDVGATLRLQVGKK